MTGRRGQTDQDSHYDGDGGHPHHDGQIDSDQRHRVTRLRHFLGDGQNEHGEGQEYGNAEGDLLSGVGREDKDWKGQGRGGGGGGQTEEGEDTHHETGEDDVVEIVECLSLDEDEEGHIWNGRLGRGRGTPTGVRLRAAGVLDHFPLLANLDIVRHN